MASEAQIRANRENAKKAGRPRLYADKLAQALVREANANAEALSKVLVRKAKDGDLPSIKEMIDRGIGKAIQNVDLTSDGEKLEATHVTVEASKLVAEYEEKLRKEMEK